jgi:bud site selection protein 31
MLFAYYLRLFIFIFYFLFLTEVNEPHEGLRKTESQWPVHQINWQKSRYVYDMFYIYHKISREVYDYCVKNKLVDAGLIAKWKKPGYERLCSTYVINPRNYKFGTVSICRVPKHCLSEGTYIEDATTGCHGCASGPGGDSNIFGNKYGQYLAAIQVAREERLQQVSEEKESGDAEGEGESDAEEDLGPVAQANGSSKAARSKASVWARDDEDLRDAVPEEAVGKLSADAAKEGRMAMKSLGGNSSGPSAKKQRVA